MKKTTTTHIHTHNVSLGYASLYRDFHVKVTVIFIFFEQTIVVKLLVSFTCLFECIGVCDLIPRRNYLLVFSWDGKYLEQFLFCNCNGKFFHFVIRSILQSHGCDNKRDAVNWKNMFKNSRQCNLIHCPLLVKEIASNYRCENGKKRHF